MPGAHEECFSISARIKNAYFFLGKQIYLLVKSKPTYQLDKDLTNSSHSSDENVKGKNYSIRSMYTIGNRGTLVSHNSVVSIIKQI